MKQDESKVLGILAIVFGALALIGSWIPIINNLSFIIGIIALILGIIGLIVNRKNKKTLAIVGTAIAVLSMAIVLMTQAFYASSLKKVGKTVESAASSVSSSIESSQQKEDEKFNWTKAQFEALTTGDIATGEGGTSYDSVISEHGTPTKENETNVNDHVSKSVTYYSMGKTYKSVVLSFTKKEDGTFALTTKVSTGLE